MSGYVYPIRPDELYHHGRKGMKWGQHIFAAVKTRRERRRDQRELNKSLLTLSTYREAAKSSGSGIVGSTKRLNIETKRDPSKSGKAYLKAKDWNDREKYANKRSVEDYNKQKKVVQKQIDDMIKKYGDKKVSTSVVYNTTNMNTQVTRLLKQYESDRLSSR